VIEAVVFAPYCNIIQQPSQKIKIFLLKPLKRPQKRGFWEGSRKILQKNTKKSALWRYSGCYIYMIRQSAGAAKPPRSQNDKAGCQNGKEFGMININCWWDSV
jgi:hypothetical protein